MTYQPQAPSQDADAMIESAPHRSNKKWLWITCLILVALVIGWKILRPSRDANTSAVEQIPVVTVISPGQITVDRTVTATGSLAARVEMPVGIVGEGGEVTRVLVQPGDWVRAGQPLALVERSVQTEQSRSLAANIEAARADTKLAQAQLDRAKALVSRGFISQADIDQRTATRDAAAARMNIATAQLAEQNARNRRLDIRAPASGLVLTRSVEPGQIIGASSGTLFRMAKDGEMEMLAQVAESDLALLRAGNQAIVTPIGSTAHFSGQLWQVSPVVDPQSRQGIARIAVRYNPAIRPGGFASASITTGTAQAPMLPESAVLHDEEGSFVYIVNQQDKAEKRRVKTGQVTDAGVSVIEGLNGRERIVASAGAFLTLGQKVKPEFAKAR